MGLCISIYFSLLRRLILMHGSIVYNDRFGKVQFIIRKFIFA